MLRSPLRWVGGKSKLRSQVLERFPEHHTYVELFGGAAWVLFGKDPATSRREVLNDLDGELVNFWRVVKHRSAEFSERASQAMASRELFNEWKLLEGKTDEVERAVRFYVVIRLSFGAKRKSCAWGLARQGRPGLWWSTAKEDAARATERLRGVWVEHLPWHRCLELYDSRETFFYVDPPYRVRASSSYSCQFGDRDHKLLAAALFRARGKWLLSYNDDAFLRELYRRSNVSIERMPTRYSLQGGNWKRVSELLIRNF